MAELGINTVRTYTPPRARAARRGRAPRPARHGRAAVVAARRLSRRPRAEADDPPRDRRARSPSSATIRRSCAFALGNEIPPGVVRWHGRHARRALPAQPVRGREGRVAGQPVHLRQLSADGISRSLVLRHLRVQRLPAPRARAARLPRAAAAHRRPEAAAARRGGRRQHSRRRRRARPRSRDAHPRRVRGRRLRRDRVRVDRRMVARRPSGRRLEVRPRRSRAAPEAGGARRRRGVRGRAVLARASAHLAARLGRRLRLQRRRHARRQPALARAAHLSGLRDHPRQRRLDAIAPARSAAASRGCASSTRRTPA